MAEDIDKLIERLAKRTVSIPGSIGWRDAPDEDSVAASRELARLAVRVSELEAERDGLREALRELIAAAQFYWSEEVPPDNFNDVLCRACAALYEDGPAAAPTPPAAEAVGGDVEALIVAAYERGAEWANENVGSGEFLSKAARDYADATMSELQRVRAAVAGHGNMQTLQETGPAASTASDDLVEEIAEVIRRADWRCELSIEERRGIARAVLSSPPMRGLIREASFLIDRLDGDLDWSSSLDDAFRDYAGHVEPSKNRLSSIISRFQSVAGSQAIASGDEGGK